jgi:2-isopropylmalate synthase
MRPFDAGATTINLPDTVGYAVPEEYGAMFRRVIDHLDGAKRHHAERALPQRSGTWAWRIPWPRFRGGARQLELTVNGIGERAGNAALEEVM